MSGELLKPLLRRRFGAIVEWRRGRQRDGTLLTFVSNDRQRPAGAITAMIACLVLRIAARRNRSPPLPRLPLL